MRMFLQEYLQCFYKKCPAFLPKTPKVSVKKAGRFL